MAALLPAGTQGALLACLVLLLVIDTDFQACKIVTTTSATTALTLSFVLTTTTVRELTTHYKSTAKNPYFSETNEHKITLEPKNGATNETKNYTLEANGRLKGELKNPTLAPKTDTVKHVIGAVLSLLAALIGLVSLVTYLIRRRKLIRRDTII